MSHLPSSNYGKAGKITPILRPDIIGTAKGKQNHTKSNIVFGDECYKIINYLKVSKIKVGLLINFGKKKCEFKRFIF